MTRTTEPVAALAAVTRLLRRHLAQQPTVQRALPNALLAEAEAPPLRQDVVEELGHQLQALLLSAGADKAAARLPGLLTKLTAAVEMMACARPRPRPRSRDTFTSTSTIRITRAGVHDHVHDHVHEGDREWRPAGRWLGLGPRTTYTTGPDVGGAGAPERKRSAVGTSVGPDLGPGAAVEAD